MRIFDRFLVSLLGLSLIALALAGGPALGAAGGVASGKARYSSPQAAYKAGLEAFKSGRPERAIPAFRFAARRGVFLAEYYLARAYAVGDGAHVDHAKAFRILERIVKTYRAVDPFLDRRAPVVARAFVLLALYYRSGLPELDIDKNVDRARALLEYAASYFDDRDAQFELARILLDDEASAAEHRAGKHWLSRLATRGHAGAQAYLAELFFRGEKLPHRPTLALALARIALENAPPSEVIWITDIYHMIYCGTKAGTRSAAEELLPEMRRYYRSRGRARMIEELPPLLGAGAVRTCENGEMVPLDRFKLQGAEDLGAQAADRSPRGAREKGPVIAERDGGAGAEPLAPLAPLSGVRGAGVPTNGFRLREAGALAPNK